MNVVADAVQKLQCVYQNASSAVRAEIPEATSITRQRIIADGNAAFRALGKEVQGIFLTELSTRVNKCCGVTVMSDTMIQEAIERQTLDVTGLIPTGLRQLRSHIKHAEQWALPQAYEVAA